MVRGLSRRSLNAIMLGSMLIIVWINLTHQSSDAPLEPLTLAPLPEQGWHLWISAEDVPVRWQSALTDQLTVAVHGANGYQLRFSVAASDWVNSLKTALPNQPVNAPAGLALQGPLTGTEMEQAAAWLITQLQVRAPVAANHDCQLDYPAAANWWNQQQGLGWAAPASSSQAGSSQADIPDRDTWQNFRQTSTRMLRQDWMSGARAIDIQSELAYHRWPENYLQTLYQDLGAAQADSTRLFAECLTSVSGRIRQ